MRYRSWNFLVFLTVSVHTVICIENQVDIHKVDYFCGNRLGDMLSTYCNSYYKRARRAVALECCKGLGCTIKYAIDNYCYEVKPEYAHLFATTRDSESVELYKLIQPKTTTKSPKSFSDNYSKILDAMYNQMSTSTSASDLAPDTKSTNGNKINQVRTRKSKSFASSPSDSYLGALRKSLRRLLRRNYPCQCKCRRNRLAQIIDPQPSLSGSYIGTDPYPAGIPVESTAKRDFFWL